MPFWNTTSTTLSNDQMYVNNAYKDANGNSKLSTITTTNPTGYVPVNANSTDSIVKKTSYAIQNDGKITYQYNDGTGNKIQYNSIQEIANDSGIGGYTAGTTAQIKDSMQKNLTTKVNDYNKANPDKKIGPSTGSPGTGDQQGQATVGELTSGIKTDEDKIRTKYGNWRYPIDMNSKQDRIKITMYQYAKKPFNESGVLTGKAFGKRELGSAMGSVVLPIQPTISDTNRVNWGETPMGAGQQAFSGLSLSAMSGSADKSVNAAVQDPATLGAAKTGVVAGLAEKAGGVSGGGLLQRLTGGIVNNNLELLFQGPALRTFSFTFSMSAREEKEAKTIRNIIRFFKQGMSVKRATSNLFIMSPNIFTIKYYYGGENTEHPWINKIKECALVDCTVNYTPAGNYATFEDGAMTQYDITLNFSELDFIYDDEYGKGEDDKDEKEIGY